MPGWVRASTISRLVGLVVRGARRELRSEEEAMAVGLSDEGKSNGEEEGSGRIAGGNYNVVRGPSSK